MSAETLSKLCDTANISADYILLGRQSGIAKNTPAASILANIAPEYSEQLETLLSAFLEAIHKAEAKEGQ